MSFTITGTVLSVQEAVQVTPALKKREIWIETPHEKYPQTLSVEFVNDKCALLDNVGINDKVDIEVELRGRQWKDKVFNTIAGWKITVQGAGANVKKQVEKIMPKDWKPVEDDSIDTLPF